MFTLPEPAHWQGAEGICIYVFIYFTSPGETFLKRVGLHPETSPLRVHLGGLGGMAALENVLFCYIIVRVTFIFVTL